MTAVAITGVGALTPAGTEASLSATMAGPPVTGEVADPLDRDLPEAVRARVVRTERVTQLAASAAGRALSGAELAVLDGSPRPECGVVLGTAFGCWLSNATHQERVRTAGPTAASPRVFAATVSNAAAGEIGIAYRLGGPAVTITAGAASGLTALLHADGLLRAGRCQVALAGGADALGPSLRRWLADAAPRLQAPTEAAAFLVLEARSHARARGARVLGTVCGGATAFEPDGTPTGDGARAAVRAALAQSGLDAFGLRVIVRAAPPAASLAEARVLADLVEEADVQILPAKSHLGETFGAAGGLGVLLALATLAPGEPALILDWCWTGHVAAMVIRREDERTG